jgi:hypothetical protein
VEQSCKGAPAGEQRQAITLGEGAIEPSGFGMDQPAIAADAPIVAQPGIERGFPHGVAAEQDSFDGGEAGALGEIDLDTAVELACGEQDGLLRQPVEMGARSCRQRGLDLCGATDGAVDALAGLGGQDHAAACGQVGGPLHAIAAGQAACGIDENGFERR